MDVELNTFVTVSNKLRITGGAGYRNMFDFYVVADYPYNMFDDLEIKIDNLITYNVFTQADFDVSDKLKLFAGLRLESISEYDLITTLPSGDTVKNPPPTYLAYHFKPENAYELIPRAALIYNLDSNNIFKLLYGRAVKQVSGNSNIDLLFTPQYTLKPAEIETYELNIISNLLDNFLINFSLFMNKIDNLISRYNVLEQNGEMVIISSNSGKMSTLGCEFGIFAKLFDKLNVDLSITYQEPENDRKGFTDIEIGYAPKFLGYMKLSYLINPDITLALNGRYVDRMLTGWNMENLDENNLPVIPLNDKYNGRIGFRLMIILLLT